MVSVRLPDGSQRQFESAVTVAQVAASIGAGLAKAALAGKVDGSVDEDGLTIHGADGAPALHAGEINGGGNASTSGSLNSLVDFGADGKGGFSLDGSTGAIQTLVNQSLTSDGIALSYSISGNTLTAKAGTTDVFTLTIDDPATGHYVFTLKAHVDHPTLDRSEEHTS